MPELPEVETMVRDLAPHVIGRRIASVEAAWPGEIVWPSYDELQARATGRKVTGVWRRGKYAVLDLEGGDILVIHRGMSGSLLRRSPEDPPDRHVRVLFRLDDGTELRLDDPRKFGRVLLLEASGAERQLPWATMGPEPSDEAFTAAELARRLQGRTALIKPLLLGQRIVAGLGNIYVDEALHRARIHPERRADTLTRREIARLHAAIRDVLRAAIERRGTTFSSYTDIEGRAGEYQDELRVFRKADAPCPVCGTPIRRLVVGGRGTHVCPRCQKL